MAPFVLVSKAKATYTMMRCELRVIRICGRKIGCLVHHENLVGSILGLMASIYAYTLVVFWRISHAARVNFINVHV